MANFDPMPDENEFMNVILGDVFKKLTNGGDPKMLGPNNFVAWEPVATVIDPTAFDYAFKGFTGNAPKIEGMTDEQYTDLRNEKKYSAYAHAEEFARLVDQIPSNIPEKDADGSRKFTIFSAQNDHTASNIYNDILDFCVVKNSKIDPKVEKKLESLRKQLFVIKKLKNPDFDDTAVEHPDDNPKFIFNSFPSPKYVKYLEYEALFYEADNKLAELKIRSDKQDPDAMAEMSISGTNYKKRRDDAQKRWETMGYKSAVEKIMNYIDEIESSNFITVKKRYESEFLAAKRTGLGGMNNYYYTAPIPASILSNRKDWTSYEFKKSDYATSSKNTKHSWSAGASYLGIFGAAGSGNHQKIDATYNFNDFEMSFKLTKCYVIRPWLGTTFIKSRFWKYSKTGNDVVNNQMVSDGNGGGLMPAVSTEFYFITDLKIGFKSGSDSYKKVEDHVKAGAAAHWGLFSIGGSYGYDNTNIETSGKRSEQGISSPGILLIGRKCNMIDLAPNPLPTIKDDEWVEVN